MALFNLSLILSAASKWRESGKALALNAEGNMLEPGKLCQLPYMPETLRKMDLIPLNLREPKQGSARQDRLGKAAKISGQKLAAKTEKD